jgi:hypothetical protein
MMGDREKLQRVSFEQQQTGLDPDLDAAVPGRRTLAERLPLAGQPSLFVHRAAAGPELPLAEADELLARASFSSGSPLPTDLQRKFESSLGTDLSAVRVHTGSESETAAKAVSAKAYTVGQDVHFGAGQYDPVSEPGKRLLAHEVAHTVQQSAASARGPQFKLEVSSPQDGAEIAADRAAAAMVSGRAVSSLPHVGLGIYRTQTDQMDTAVDGAVEDTKKSIDATSVTSGRTFSVDPRARDEVNGYIRSIEGWTNAMNEQRQMHMGGALNSSGAGSDITADKIAANTTAVINLREYSAGLDNQSADLGGIRAHYASVQVDYTRAIGSINAAASLNGVDLTAAQGEGKFAADIMAGSMGVNKTQATAAGAANATAISQLTSKANQYNTQVGELDGLASKVKAATATLKGAVATMNVRRLEGEIKDKKDALQTAMAQEAAIKGVVSSVTTTALNVLGIGSVAKLEMPDLGGAGDRATSEAKTYAGKGLEWIGGQGKDNGIDGPITDAVSKFAGIRPQINTLNEALGKLNAEKSAAEDQAAAAKVDSATATLEAALKDFATKLKSVENLKAQLRDEWQRLGVAMDKAAGGGQKFSVLLKTVGEADAFFGQGERLFMAINSWLKGSKVESSDQKAKLNDKAGLVAYEFILMDPSNRTYGCVRHDFAINAMALNSNEGENPVVRAKQMKAELRGWGGELLNYRNRMLERCGINVPYPRVGFMEADKDA